MKIDITIQKARDGRDYVQIMSDDFKSINIVLIADKIIAHDRRPKEEG